MTHPIGRTIWIARHGNRMDFADPNWRHTAERPHDPHLSPDGVVQARKLAKRISGETIEHIFASPFLRTVETAHYSAESLNRKIKIEHGACEWLNPEWFPAAPELIPPREMVRRFPSVDLNYTSRMANGYPEPDEREHCWLRAGKTARLLAQEFSGNILIVCHGASMLGMAYGLVEGEPPIHCGLCALIEIVWDGTRWKMELSGDVSYLE